MERLVFIPNSAVSKKESIITSKLYNSKCTFLGEFYLHKLKIS